MTDSLRVACPNCQAQPGHRCTAPDDRSRHDVSLVHYARETAYAEELRKQREA